MQAYVGDAVPYERRGRVMSLLEISWSLSWFVGIPIAGFVIAAVLGVPMMYFLTEHRPQVPVVRAQQRPTCRLSRRNSMGRADWAA